MWKPNHRLTAGWCSLRYPSDLSDAEWMLVAPMMPPARRGGRRRCTRGVERNFLCAVDRLPMEGDAEGSAAEEHGAFLFHVMGLGGHVGAYSRHALYSSTRSSRARSKSHGGNHRLPKQQGRSKRGSALDPQGFDAGGPQTPHPRRHARSPARRERPCRRHPGPRRRARPATLRRATIPFVEKFFADGGYQGPKMAKRHPIRTSS